MNELPFYQYKKEPWLSEPVFECLKNLHGYVLEQKLFERLHLASAKRAHDGFINALADVHPEIASKKFGYTLGADASIKVIDYDESLTEAERDVLTKALNGFEGFKSELQRVAKSMMTLIDHDDETFGGRYAVSIESFQHVIDFNKVLRSSIEDMHDEWVGQVKNHAEQQGSSHIDLTV
ncbi:hypothetical protein AUC61_22360 [Pseudomonas sp. S25]|uniref:Uncharacterized protein n=1 Tax=Pseudomonas maioricensis TaxID=1766623 RepID=A0ABS9ZNX5_9PSED|nr:hypothetical protein [Pseudomonas sp. S25]